MAVIDVAIQPDGRTRVWFDCRLPPRIPVPNPTRLTFTWVRPSGTLSKGSHVSRTAAAARLIARREVELLGEPLLDDGSDGFQFYENGGGAVAKKMAGYHQYHAVNAAVEETLRAAWIDWQAARAFADTGPGASTSQLAILDLAVALGENRYRLSIMGADARRHPLARVHRFHERRAEGVAPAAGGHTPDPQALQPIRHRVGRLEVDRGMLSILTIELADA